MSTTETEIASVRKQIESATEQLRALEARAAEEAARKVKWEPKGGDYCIRGLRDVSTVLTPSPHSSFYSRRMEDEREFARAGLRWPTRAAAESALPYLAFFQRLVALAQELNPSGKVGGSHYVTVRTDLMNRHQFCGKQTATGSPVYMSLFETQAAADRAAEIMNRDGWVCPTMS